MTPLAWTASLLFGAVVGVVSGLLGIGGGALLVPFLYLLIGGAAWSGVVLEPDSGVVVAHATSLLVTLPTAASGLLAYRAAGLVDWAIVVRMGLGAALGAVAGAQVAPRLDPSLLQGLFGALLILAATRMLVHSESPTPEGVDQSSRWAVMFPFGLAIGFFAALLGVGGGIFAVPLLVHFSRLGLERIAATSLGVIVFASGAGSVTYMLTAHGAPVQAGTIGFVLVPAAIALLPGAVVGAHGGAALNRRLGGAGLRYVFAGLFLILGARYLIENALRLLG